MKEDEHFLPNFGMSTKQKQIFAKKGKKNGVWEKIIIIEILSNTPFNWRPPRSSHLKTSDLHWRPTDFYWKLPDFLLEILRLLLRTHIFYLKL